MKRNLKDFQSQNNFLLIFYVIQHKYQIDKVSLHDNWNLREISIRKSNRHHYMEHWTRFKCILTKNNFLIVDLSDYCNYFDDFKYGLLYSENDFKHRDFLLVKVERCNLIERNL